MLVLLPISCWLLLLLIRASRLNCLRQAFLEASILWASFAVIVTEILSMFTSFTQIAVGAAWGIALLACVAVAVKNKSSFASPHWLTYHFFGHAIGKTYNHLSMAVYLPESNTVNDWPEPVQSK
ncbi:hypothetical protein BH10CYA1_BH10CYA1_27440 [soil metagenome]